MSAPVAMAKDGRPQLMATKCSTCIFRPGNPMRLRRGRVAEMVRDALAGGGYITCHQTLRAGDHPELGHTICRGFYDVHGARSNLIRIFQRLGGFAEITPSERPPT